MIGELANHLWQSTLFAIAAGLLTIAFRKNRAEVRYWLWFIASIKFLVPFALLMSLGGQLEWAPSARKIPAPAISLTIMQVSQPFPETLPPTPSTRVTRDWVPIGIFGIWMCGFAAIALIQFRSWRNIRAAVRASTPIEIPATVEVRSSPGLLEPGVVGLLRPVLLLPAGIAERLTPPQLEAVLAHELCHVRRRDNLTAAIHMIVEAIFWFHPLVWWIGARLVEERERACDEEVLSVGGNPRDYAEAILNICKLYAESPLVWVSGITGSDIKRRIQQIMTHRAPRRLGRGKELLLAAIAVAVVGGPVAIGVISAPFAAAQTQSPAPLKFEVASVKENHSGRLGTDGFQVFHGNLTVRNVSLKMLIQAAYRIQGARITGGPRWLSSDRFDIAAKGMADATNEQVYSMLQSLLAERFKLSVHNEDRVLPIYSLEVAKGGTKLPGKDGADCVPITAATPDHSTATLECGKVGRFLTQHGGAMIGQKVSLPAIAGALSGVLDRPVVDRTNLKRTFDLSLTWAEASYVRPARQEREETRATGSDDVPPSIFTALQEQLGLKLVATKGRVQVLMIDHAERPSKN